MLMTIFPSVPEAVIGAKNAVRAFEKRLVDASIGQTVSGKNPETMLNPAGGKPEGVQWIPIFSERGQTDSTTLIFAFDGSRPSSVAPVPRIVQRKSRMSCVICSPGIRSGIPGG